jgi:hypothetical protein
MAKMCSLNPKQMFFVILALWASVARAGTESSGGGNAVVCLDEDKKIVSAELLDIYEGRALHGLNPLPASVPYQNYASSLAEKIDAAIDIEHVNFAIGRKCESLLTAFKFLPSGTGLVPINDSKHIILPKNCSVVQLARYEENDEVFVDQDIWDHLDETNKAALVIHESVYWYLRLHGEKTSERTRRAVAQLFSGADFVPVEEGIPVSALECVAGTNPDRLPEAAFYLYPNSNHGLTAQFVILDGKMMLAKTTGSLPAIEWPLTKKRESIFGMLKLESVVDGGLGIMLSLQPGRQVKGKIGIHRGVIELPNVPFVCSPKEQTH